ncbi:HNH nuclease [Candidatus Planktophila dulcis]|uniref:HNH endonuclease n=1 Tax=Candidatus Planktophila dulcis TaxID=1884914 RepID=UPI003BEEBBB0
MRYWWVNQNQTYSHEYHGGFLWSPKTRADGGANPFYKSMEQVSPGDLVFSYTGTFIRAIGIVQRRAVTAPKPDFDGAGDYWSKTGWYVECEFSEVLNPIQPKKYLEAITPFLKEKYAPLQLNGNGKQIVYLTEISSAFADLIISLTQSNIPLIQQELAPSEDLESEYEINLEIESRHLEGDLEKIQLTKSRRGQGLFKSNVRLIENHCRVTEVSNIKHLRASHIKPWSLADNIEKLDGNNGLLLSPHVDHLFDRGFISFTTSGNIEISKELNPHILVKWGIDPKKNVGSFTTRQGNYLEFHRETIFQG